MAASAQNEATGLSTWKRCRAAGGRRATHSWNLSMVACGSVVLASAHSIRIPLAITGTCPADFRSDSQLTRVSDPAPSLAAARSNTLSASSRTGSVLPDGVIDRPRVSIESSGIKTSLTKVVERDRRWHFLLLFLCDMLGELSWLWSRSRSRSWSWSTDADRRDVPVTPEPSPGVCVMVQLRVRLLTELSRSELISWTRRQSWSRSSFWSSESACLQAHQQPHPVRSKHSL